MMCVSVHHQGVAVSGIADSAAVSSVVVLQWTVKGMMHLAHFATGNLRCQPMCLTWSMLTRHRWLVTVTAVIQRTSTAIVVVVAPAAVIAVTLVAARRH